MVLVPLYVRLVNLTEQAVRNVQSLEQMMAEATKIWEGHGCRVVNAWSTFGPYDLVALIEGPDNATVMKATALVAKAGAFRAVTMPAVPLKDFAASVR